MANYKRLIDAKAFDLRVSQRKTSEVVSDWKDLPQEIQDMLCKHGKYIHLLLETQLTVDAVEVVRCKDCKKRHPELAPNGGVWCAVWLLILEGISSIWEFIDVAMFGESQRSAADALAAVFMTDWFYSKIWRKDNDL